MTGTVSRALFLLICSHAIARQVSRMPWHPVPRRAFWLYLRAGALTCSRLIKLRLLIFYVYYKEAALFFGFYSGFTSGEYHVIRVDFIFSSRGRLERDRGFANPLSLSNTSPDPWGYPLRRGILAAAGLQGFSQLVSGADCLLPLRYIVWVLCVRAWTVRVSVDFVGLWAFVFHYWWDGLFVPAATVGFAMVYRWNYHAMYCVG